MGKKPETDFIKRSGALIHLKSYAIDGEKLRTELANFSASGERRQDNDLIGIRDAKAAVELIKIERQIRNTMVAVKAGPFSLAIKDELAALEERKARLVEFDARSGRRAVDAASRARNLRELTLNCPI